MKTWFDYWVALLLGFLLPILAGLLPTFKHKGDFYGGGIIREYLVNIYIKLIPAESANKIVDLFQQGGDLQEFLLYLMPAINLSLIAMWVLFLLVSIKISILNWYLNSKRNLMDRNIK